MLREEKGDLAYYTFDSLRGEAHLLHAISTRHGGTSPAPYDTLNLSRTAGDDIANVAANLGRFHAALGLDPAATVSAFQAQADRVAVVGLAERGTIVRDVDALLTNKPGVALLLRYADCVPIILFDPVNSAVALVHAGWRGTVAKIATKAARAMCDAFGTRPQDLIAGVAPSIGPCCYQVGADVIQRTRDAFGQADRLLTTQTDGTIHLDLWQANMVQLRSLGVRRIESSEICTSHHTEDFFSWRAEQAKTGRFGAMVCLRA